MMEDEVLLFLTWFLYCMYVLIYAIRWFYEDFKRRKDKKKNGHKSEGKSKEDQ